VAESPRWYAAITSRATVGADADADADAGMEVDLDADRSGLGTIAWPPEHAAARLAQVAAATAVGRIPAPSHSAATAS
jgi:hypothetical protein